MSIHKSKFNISLCEDFLCEKNKRPLFGVMWEPMLLPPDSFTGYKQKKLLAPGDVTESEFSGTAQKILNAAGTFKQDMPFALQPGGGLQWLEAICGCGIAADHGQIWATRGRKDQLDMLISGATSGPWSEKLSACMKRLAEELDGKGFNAVPVLHGPLDILYAIMGGQELVYCMYDEPERAKAAIDAAAGIFLRMAGKLSAMLKPYLGGYCGRMHIYTKKPCVTLQDDASYLTSPDMYREFVLPAEKSIAAGLSQTVYHAHNSSLHILEALADSGVSVVQVTVDPNGPPMEEQIKVYKRLKQKLPLVLSCWSFDDLERLMAELTPEGLSLTFIPAPDGCKVNRDGVFDEISEWNKRYEEYLKFWAKRNASILT